MSRLLGPDSRRSPWTASPPEAGSDFAEDVVDAEGATAPFSVKTRACRIRSSCSVCFLRPPRPEKHTLAALAKLRLFSSCFEHLDSVGNRDVCVSESCFSRKGRVRYPYPRGVGIPRLGRPCRLRVLSSFSGSRYRSGSQKHEGRFGRKFFPRKILTQRGFPPSSPRGRVGLC